MNSHYIVSVSKVLAIYSFSESNHVFPLLEKVSSTFTKTELTGYYCIFFIAYPVNCKFRTYCVYWLLRLLLNRQKCVIAIQ